MKSHPRFISRRAAIPGFTLIELLVVIVIIGILAALTLGAFRYAQESAARNRTVGAHAAIKAALEQYKEKFGEYPEPKDGAATTPIGGSTYRSGGAQMLYQAITGDGSSAIKLSSTAEAGESNGKVDDDELENVINGTLPTTLIYPPPSQLSAGASGVRMLVDGWYRPFQYSKGEADTLNPTYDLWSFGPMKTGAGASYSIDAKRDNVTSATWIKNW